MRINRFLRLIINFWNSKDFYVWNCFFPSKFYSHWLFHLLVLTCKFLSTIFYLTYFLEAEAAPYWNPLPPRSPVFTEWLSLISLHPQLAMPTERSSSRITAAGLPPNTHISVWTLWEPLRELFRCFFSSGSWWPIVRSRKQFRASKSSRTFSVISPRHYIIDIVCHLGGLLIYAGGAADLYNRSISSALVDSEWVTMSWIFARIRFPTFLCLDCRTYCSRLLFLSGGSSWLYPYAQFHIKCSKLVLPSCLECPGTQTKDTLDINWTLRLHSKTIFKRVRYNSSPLIQTWLSENLYIRILFEFASGTLNLGQNLLYFFCGHEPGDYDPLRTKRWCNVNWCYEALVGHALFFFKQFWKNFDF